MPMCVVVTRGTKARSAGCPVLTAAYWVNPKYESPNIPTRPSLHAAAAIHESVS